MANRQIFQLGSGTPLVSNFLAFQDSAGISEAFKGTVQQLKAVMVPYSAYGAIVTLSAGPTFSVTVVQNNLSATLTFTNPSNGLITVTASVPTFSNITTVCLSNSINDAGTPYFVAGQYFSSTVVNFKISLHDGTAASTPLFVNHFFEIRVYA